MTPPIARSIIGLADNLGWKSLRKVLKTRRNIPFWKASGCRAFQGYFFSRPRAASELETAGSGQLTLMDTKEKF